MSLSLNRPDVFRDEESEEILEKLRPAADWIETALKVSFLVVVDKKRVIVTSMRMRR